MTMKSKRKNKNKLFPVIVGILLAGFVVSVLFASSKDIANFMPQAIADESSSLHVDVEKEAFDSSQKGNDGLAADENTDNSKKLNELEDQMIQDKTDNGLIISGESSEASSLTGAVNGAGNTVVIGNGGENNGSGNNNSQGEGINTGTNYVHSGEITYGDDDSPETGNINSTLEGFYKSGAEITSLTCNTAPAIYLCPGEQPDSDYISNAINVTISVMIPGSARRFPPVSGTRYIYKNDTENYKGDYIIDWDVTKPGIQSTVPTSLGAYNAKVYGYNPVTDSKGSEGETTFLYNVIDYRVSLLDFSEDFTNATAMESQLVQTSHASGNRLCDLSQAKANLNSRILARTSADKGYKFVYQTSGSTYTGYFSGWATSNAIAGSNSYVVSRPTAASDVKVDRTTRQRYYEETLVPVWSSNKIDDKGFHISINDSGEITLDGYDGEPSAVKSIDVPEGVTVLDLKSFGKKAYKNLSLINIPDSVIEIIFPDDMSSFPALSGFGVSDNNQRFLDVNGILYNKAGKKLIKVPPTTTAISKWSDRVNEVGPSAFAGVKIKGNIELPSTVNTIDDQGFINCSIDSLVLKNNNVSFGINAFSTPNKDKLTVGTITVNSSDNDEIYLKELNKLVKSLYDSGYADYDDLATSSLLDQDGTKNKYAIVNNLILTNDKTTLVSTTSLCEDSVTIPSSVTTIKDNALSNEMLTDVYFQSNNSAPPLRTVAFGNAIPENLRIHVPSTSLNSVYMRSWSGARGTLGSDAFDTYVIPYGEGVTTDSSGGVYYGGMLVDGRSVEGEYTVAEGTTAIKQSAFRNNTKVTRITLDEAMARINGYAFSNCSQLSEVKVTGNNLAWIGDRAFFFCSSFSSFIWPTVDSTMKLNNIGESAFYSTALTGMPNRIGRTQIGDLRSTLQLPTEDVSAFNSCVIFEGEYKDADGNVKTAFVNLKYIGEYAFADCQKYIYLSIPKNITVPDGMTWFEYINSKIDPSWFVTDKDIYPVGSSFGTITSQGGSGGGSGGDSGGEII